MQTTIKISVVIITYNEQKNIERCLKSVQGVADEIIVLDSFSTDDTELICKQYPVRFHQHIFDGHIEQKNRAVALSNFDYVLSLDADEALSDELRASIIYIKEKFICAGYEVNRLTNYCGIWIKHSGWYPDKKLRLFDKRKGAWGGTNPHDKYILTNKNAMVGFLKGDILHYSYYSKKEHIDQTKYFSSIAAQAYFNKGKKSYWYQLIVNPATKFISHYFIRKGFLDGVSGFTIAKLAAWGTYLKYKELNQLWKNNSGN